MNKYKIPAVILGLGVNGLAIARSLGVRGIPVWGVYDYEDDQSIGRFSKYCKAISIPLIDKKENLFLQKLIETLGDISSKPVLFAESDRYVEFLSRNRIELNKYFRFLLPDEELLNTLMSKDKSTVYMESKGIHIPKTFFIKDITEYDNHIKNIKYPCILKPIDSFSNNLGKKIFSFSDELSLSSFINTHETYIGKAIIQEIIPGGDPNTYQATSYVSLNRNACPIFTMRKIRQRPPDFGITSYGISEEHLPLRNIVNNFINSVPYRGFMSIEFKLHPITNEWIYIELNPRLPYYNALIYDSGINFPFIYYKDMIGDDITYELNKKQINGRKWIDFLSDYYTFRLKYATRQIGFLNWLRSVIRANSYAVYDINDLRPFFYTIYYYSKKSIGKIIKIFNFDK